MAKPKIKIKLSDTLTLKKKDENNLIINAGKNGKIEGLSNGTDDADAINLSQLKSLATVLGMTDSDNDGVFDAPSYKVGGTTPVGTIQEAFTALSEVANSGLKFSANKLIADEKIATVKTGETLDISKVENSKNITIALSPSDKKYTIGIQENPVFKGVVKGEGGFNANNKQIINVLAGDKETDAVNVSQLNTVKAAILKDFKGKLKLNVTSLAGSAPVTYTTKEGEIVVVHTDGKFYKKTDIDKIDNTGNTDLKDKEIKDTKDLIISLHPNTTSSAGKISDSKKLTHVADGLIEEGSTEAINGSQLFTTNSNVTNVTNDVADVKNNLDEINYQVANKIIKYTDEDGNEIVQGQDGKKYKKKELDDKVYVKDVGYVLKTDTEIDGDTGKLKVKKDVVSTPVKELTQDEVKGIKHSLLNTDGSTTNPTKLSNMAKGKIAEKSTDAINGSQLNDVATKIGLTLNAAKDGFEEPELSQLKNSDKKKTVISALNAATEELNKGILFDGNSGNGNNSKVQQLGSKLSVVAAERESGEDYSTSNITTKYKNEDGNGTITISMKEKPEFKALTVKENGKPTTVISPKGITIMPIEAGAKSVNLTDKGLDNGGNKIVDVAAGEVSDDSKDVITGAQLAKIHRFLGVTAADINTFETLNSGLTKNENAPKEYKTIIEKLNDVGGGWVVAVNDNEATNADNIDGISGATWVKPNKIVAFVGENENVTTSYEGDIEKTIEVKDEKTGIIAKKKTKHNRVKIKISDNPNFKSVNIVGDDKTPLVTLNKDGIDFNEAKAKITGLADITDSDGDSVATNKKYVDSKLDIAANNLAAATITYKANKGSANTVKLTDGLDFTNTTNTTTEVATNGVVKVKINDELKDMKSISSKEGTKIALGEEAVRISDKDGKDAKLTGIKNGEITSGSTDAVTGEQLSDLADKLGLAPDSATGRFISPKLTALMNPKGKVATAPTNIVEGLNGVVGKLNSGIIFNGNAGNTENPKAQLLGSTLNVIAAKKVKGESYSKENLTTEYVNEDGNGTITISMKEKPEFKALKVTEEGKDIHAEIKPYGIEISKTGDKDLVSLTNVGLDNGGNTIKSVGDGEKDTDAVNKRQLDAVAAKAKGDNPFEFEDKDGNSVVKIGDKFYPVGTILDENGNAVDTKGDKVEPLTEEEEKALIVSAKGATKQMGNIASGLGVKPEAGKALTEDVAETAVSNLLDEADIKALNKVATVGDLQAVSKAGLNFAGDAGTDVHRNLSEKLSIVGGVTETAKLSDNNIGVVANGKDKLSVKLAKELKKLTSVETVDAAGNKTVQTGKGIEITPADVNKAPVKLTTSGLNNGGNTLKGVGDAVEQTDAVNKKQLDEVAAKAKGNNPFEYTDATGNVIVKAADGKFYPADKVGADGKVLTGAIALTKEEEKALIVSAKGATKQIGNIASGLGVNPEAGKALTEDVAKTTINNLLTEAGEKALNKVATVGDLQAVSKAGLNFKADDGTTVHKNLSEELVIVGGAEKTKLSDNNIGVNSTTDGKLEVKLAKDLKGITTIAQNADGSGSKLELTDEGVKISKDGKNTRLTGVADGVKDNDAVNMKQLNATLGTTVDENGNIVTNTATEEISVTVDENGNIKSKPEVEIIKHDLTTHNVSGTEEITDNTVITAISRMNKGGIKYFHTNDSKNKFSSKNQETNGVDSSAAGAFSTAIGYKAKVGAEGTNGIAIGNGSQANNINTIAIGSGNIVNGKNSGAIGDPSVIDAANSYSIGNNNTLAKGSDNSFILGNDVKIAENLSGVVALGNKTNVTTKGSVALGENSVAGKVHIAKGTVESGYTYGALNDSAVAGKPTENTAVVSVGDKGKERQVQNVAAGEISKTSTDAINGSQLYATQASMTNNTVAAIGNIEQKLADSNDRLKSGIAGTTAMAGIEFMEIGVNQATVAAAVGGYRGHNSVAVGVEAAPTINTRLNAKAAVTPSKHNTDYLYSVGAAYRFNWK